jgi:starch synthase
MAVTPGGYTFQMPYRVLFVTAEYAPLAKTGGLADVSAALTRELHRRGHDVRVFLPLYRDAARRAEALVPVDYLQDLSLTLGTHAYSYRVLTGRAPGSDLPLYFIDCPALYDRAQIYGEAEDESRRFLLLTRAAFECAQRMGFAPHILHCNDWHTAFAPLLLKTTYAWDRLFAGTRSVLTIHNVAYQGVFGAAHATELGLGDASWLLHQDDLAAGRVNTLLHGVMYADLVTTVSPTYAREICTPEYGAGLDGFLRARGARVVGILNGVDYDEWDPAHDAHLPAHYDRANLAGKVAARHALAERTGLALGAETMVYGLVSRLVTQKGIDLMIPALPAFLRRQDAALAVLGSGEARYEAFFEALVREFPGRVAFSRGYDEPLAHRIEAGADAFLMPSQYEPCGLNQMYSLRYGTPPIVRRTGGLADSVRHYERSDGTGTGIVFDHYDAASLGWALDYATGLFREGTHWRRMIDNGMAEDYSWSTQGTRYVEEYAKLVGPA